MAKAIKAKHPQRLPKQEVIDAVKADKNHDKDYILKTYNVGENVLSKILSGDLKFSKGAKKKTGSKAKKMEAVADKIALDVLQAYDNADKLAEKELSSIPAQIKALQDRQKALQKRLGKK